jgi:hypothetical protein
MGMYTQAKGMLNVVSIGDSNDYLEVRGILEELKDNFKKEELVDRTWVCDYTQIMQSSNGSVFIFFGIELKDYSNEIRMWIDYLLKGFPNAEGKFDIQYETQEFPTTLYVQGGKIVDEKLCHIKQVGYGNCWR